MLATDARIRGLIHYGTTRFENTQIGHLDLLYYPRYNSYSSLCNQSLMTGLVCVAAHGALCPGPDSARAPPRDRSGR